MPGRPNNTTVVGACAQRLRALENYAGGAKVIAINGRKRTVAEVVAIYEECLGSRAELAQMRRAVLRVQVERGMTLVVEVVQERDDAPALLVLTEVTGVPAGRRLDREGVAQQRLPARVAGQCLPGEVAIQFHGRGVR